MPKTKKIVCRKFELRAQRNATQRERTNEGVNRSPGQAQNPILGEGDIKLSHEPRSKQNKALSGFVLALLFHCLPFFFL